MALDGGVKQMGQLYSASWVPEGAEDVFSRGGGPGVPSNDVSTSSETSILSAAASSLSLSSATAVPDSPALSAASAGTLEFDKLDDPSAGGSWASDSLCGSSETLSWNEGLRLTSTLG